MCTAVGFSYLNGHVFGRTMEFGFKFDTHVIHVPAGVKGFTESTDSKFDTKYASIGTSIYETSFINDGVNEKGLTGSANLFPKYASFAEKPVSGRKNMTMPNLFPYLLTRCKDVEEIKEEIKDIVIVGVGDHKYEVYGQLHCYFRDTKGNNIVLEPENGELKAYDNPYGTLTNSPSFPWHETNLKNYINIGPVNVEEKEFNDQTLTKFGEGSGLVGLPGDFTPPSRFVRAAHFVAQTPKDLSRNKAIMQGFRILAQADIPTGAIISSQGGGNDQTIYTTVMDSKTGAYFIKYHDNMNVQGFYLDDFKDHKEVQVVDTVKEMTL